MYLVCFRCHWLGTRRWQVGRHLAKEHPRAGQWGLPVHSRSLGRLQPSHSSCPRPREVSTTMVAANSSAMASPKFAEALGCWIGWYHLSKKLSPVGGVTPLIKSSTMWTINPGPTFHLLACFLVCLWQKNITQTEDNTAQALQLQPGQHLTDLQLLIIWGQASAKD